MFAQSVSCELIPKPGEDKSPWSGPPGPHNTLSLSLTYVFHFKQRCLLKVPLLLIQNVSFKKIFLSFKIFRVCPLDSQRIGQISLLCDSLSIYFELEHDMISRS
jgi:hypothetical protein